MHTRRTFAGSLTALTSAAALAQPATAPIPIGSRRELFVDHELIADRKDVVLTLATPVDCGPVLQFDKPWEGNFSAYTTILADGPRFLMYYRGVRAAGQDGRGQEVTCLAESSDGIHWTKPELTFYPQEGHGKTNIVYAGDPPFSHNFTPFLDMRPGVPDSERFKAVAGVHRTGLAGFTSADGLRWRKLRPEPLVPSPPGPAFDSQNLVFWSAAEQRYVLYCRTFKKLPSGSYRWVSRSTSEDFLHWTPLEEMSYGDAPPEHLYTNQTSAYFRAPHIYIGICARFLPGRQVLTEQQAREIGVDPQYFKDCSDAVFVTSRGGNRYTRTFMEAFLRPGLGLQNWVSRSNYPALNLARTGPSMMSFYVNRNYGQPSAYLRRYELRLDGFASARAGYRGGELVTRPLTFEGSRLELNFSTSAAGSVRVELQDLAGRPIPGFSLADATELVGDEIVRTFQWAGNGNLSNWRGKPVRIRFLLKDADLYSFRFSDGDGT